VASVRALMTSVGAVRLELVIVTTAAITTHLKACIEISSRGVSPTYAVADRWSRFAKKSPSLEARTTARDSPE
jgi:hypothetical protein